MSGLLHALYVTIIHITTLLFLKCAYYLYKFYYHIFNAVPSILTCTTTTFFHEHIQAKINIYSPALDAFAVTRADGEPRERGESSAEFGMSKFAVDEPAK